MARQTKADLEKQIEELKAEVSKWQQYHLKVLQENGKLKDQLDSKQISEHSGTIKQMEQELKTQKEVNRHLRESLARQREKLNAKDNMIDMLRQKIEQLESGQAPDPGQSSHVQTRQEPEEHKKGKSGRPRYKLSDRQIDEIKTKVAEGYSYRKIAKEYGITAGYVSRIVA